MTDLHEETRQGPTRLLQSRFVELARGLHEGITVQPSAVEVRLFLGSDLLCRVVPYRELLHVQIGDSPGWETRVRDEGGFLEAVDRLLHRFLLICSGPPVP